MISFEVIFEIYLRTEKQLNVNSYERQNIIY